MGYILEDDSFPSFVSGWMNNGTVLAYMKANPSASILELVGLIPI